MLRWIQLARFGPRKLQFQGGNSDTMDACFDLFDLPRKLTESQTWRRNIVVLTRFLVCLRYRQPGVLRHFFRLCVVRDSAANTYAVKTVLR